MDKSLMLLFEAQLAMHKYCFGTQCTDCKLYDGTQECPYLDLLGKITVAREKIMAELNRAE